MGHHHNITDFNFTANIVRKNRVAGICMLCICWGFAPSGMLSAQSTGSPLRGGSWINDCDFCLASQGISPLEAGSSGLRIDVRYLHVGTPYRDGTKIDNTHQELETHLTQQYSFFYSVSNRFSLAALLPVPYRHSERRDDEGIMVTGNQFGVGDLSLLLRYKPLESHSLESTTILSFTGGLKLPSGRTDGRDSRGDLLDAHIQIGTGSTDVLVGMSGLIAWESSAFITNLLCGLTTMGANHHQFGNNLNYSLAFRMKILPADFGETQAFATLGIDGEWRGKETQDGVTDDNSGGNVAYISPGVQIFLSPVISLEAMYQYAVLHALHGEQLGEDYRILTGVQIQLE